ncbi:MAG: peptide/nickel transport system ATP-binding protein [Actinomycetota bacterium]|nr:peptide/nickel transport system ATP-binding protein [Actinomycetota bacterium]
MTTAEPAVGPDAPVAGTAPLLEVRDLVKHFPIRSGFAQRVTGQVHAVCGVSFDVLPGETLGIVGESGCGKSTAVRAVLRLVQPSSGSVRFRGVEVTTMRGGELRRMRRKLQIVFQDP